MRRNTFSNYWILSVLLLAVAVVTSVGQAGSNDEPAPAKHQQSASPEQSTAIQGVAAEVDLSCDRSVKSNTQQLPDGNVVTGWNSGDDTANAPPPTAMRAKPVSATTWLPRRMANHSYTNQSPTRTTQSFPSPPVSPLTGPPVPAPRVTPNESRPPRIPAPPAKARPQDEARGQRARALRKQFLHDCGQRGLSESECRLTFKNRVPPTVPSSSERVAIGQAHPQP